jgi:hypothetical protein
VLGPDFPTGARNSWVHFCVWFYAHECIFVWFLRMSALLCVVCTYECTFVCGFYAWVHFCVISTRECTFVCGFYAWVHFCVWFVRMSALLCVLCAHTGPGGVGATSIFTAESEVRMCICLCE